MARRRPPVEMPKVLYGGRGVGVRRVAETTMDEVVRLIVGANGPAS